MKRLLMISVNFASLCLKQGNVNPNLRGQGLKVQLDWGKRGMSELLSGQCQGEKLFQSVHLEIRSNASPVGLTFIFRVYSLQSDDWIFTFVIRGHMRAARV